MVNRAGFFTLLSLAALVASCDWSASNIDRWRYSCQTSEDCGDGFSCENAVCVSVSRVDAGATDSGIPDSGMPAFDGGRACHHGWCWVQPRPFGVDFGIMLSPDTVLAPNASEWLLIDGGDFQYLSMPNAGRCLSGTRNGGDAWFACENGLLRYTSSGGALISYPVAVDHLSEVQLASSDEGGLWLNIDGEIFRRQGNGWIAVTSPACRDQQRGFAPLSITTAAYACAKSPSADTELFLLSPGLPMKVGSFSTVGTIIGRSPERLYMNYLNDTTLDVQMMQLSVDGGAAPFYSPLGIAADFASDGQLYQANSALHQYSGTWSATQAFTWQGRIDLEGTSGVHVESGILTLFNGAGQHASVATSDMAADDRRDYDTGAIIGGAVTPRFLFQNRVYAISETGSLSLVGALPVDLAGPAAASADGGIAFASVTDFYRSDGTGFVLDTLPTEIEQIVPMGNGAWLLKLASQLMFINGAGTSSRFDVLDGGAGLVPTIASASQTEVVLIAGSTTQVAVRVNRQTLQVQPFALPTSPTLDVCSVDSKFYALTLAGVMVFRNNTWVNLGGPAAGKLFCNETRRQVYCSDTGDLFDVSVDGWLPHRSPTRGNVFVDSHGRYWVTGRGGTIVVQQ